MKNGKSDPTAGFVQMIHTAVIILLCGKAFGWTITLWTAGGVVAGLIIIGVFTLWRVSR